MGFDLVAPMVGRTAVNGRQVDISTPVLVSLVALAWMTITAGAAFAAGSGKAAAYIPRLSSYLQVRYTDPGTSEDLLAVRRFKVILDGGPANRFRYHLQFIYKTNNESATDDRIFLQDAHILYPAGAGFVIKAGQFIPPFGLERFQPDRNLDFVERTEVTTRLVVDGNLGDSFARDRGLEGDWGHGSWEGSIGVFQGSGANNALRGNGPLGVTRLSYGRDGSPPHGRQWSWRAGWAGSLRHATDLNFSAQLPGLSKDVTGHFRGRDTRLNLFVQGRWGPIRTQGEYFRVWLTPASGDDIVAFGAYGQVAYLPVKGVILALRREWFNPDVRALAVPTSRQWTTAATYDFSGRLRLATDYSWAEGGTEPSAVWRIQVQYILVRGLLLRP